MRKSIPAFVLLFSLFVLPGFYQAASASENISIIDGYLAGHNQTAQAPESLTKKILLLAIIASVYVLYGLKQKA